MKIKILQLINLTLLQNIIMFQKIKIYDTNGLWIDTKPLINTNL